MGGASIRVGLIFLDMEGFLFPWDRPDELKASVSGRQEGEGGNSIGMGMWLYWDGS